MDASGLTGVAAVLGIAKEIVSLARDGKATEITQRVIDLQSAIIDLQMQMSALLDENRGLRDQVTAVARNAELDSDLEMRLDGRFLVRKSEAQHGLIPYCPICWGDNKKLVPLTLWAAPEYFKCGIHSVRFSTQAHKDHEKRSRDQQAKMPNPGNPWIRR